MPSIKSAPLPYHTRVKGFIDETGDIEIEVLNDLGQWQSKIIEQEQFRSMTNGTQVFYMEFDQDWDDYTDELWVPDAER